MLSGKNGRLPTNEEPMLFRTARHPQYPQKCVMPDPAAVGQRRLGETVARRAAEAACARFAGAGAIFENCVYDVMAVGDVDIAAGIVL
jgi:hypothetical protein